MALIEKYKKIGCKCMISNDYDYIICEINDFMKDVRIKCDHTLKQYIFINYIKSTI